MNANRPYIVGLTGGIGCGKSEAAAYLETLGAVHIDADAISRELTQSDDETLRLIREQFGDEVFAADGTLDRAKLAGVVFNSEPHRRALEKIMHPRVQSHVWSQIESAGENGAKVVVLDVPLLFETGMDVLCNETWTVTAGPETQLARVTARGLTVEQAQARIRSQMDSEDRMKRSTRVIDTDRSVERTRSELNSLYQQVLKKAD